MSEFNELFNDEEIMATNAKIKVIGVGGAGCNAVNQMINDKKDLIEYIVVNTDGQALANSECRNKYVLGKNITKGLGAGGNPEVGKQAAEDSYSDLQLLVKDSDMVFIACGEGGGTGTGAAPVVAKAAREIGALILAIVTRPFNMEGRDRRLNAIQGIAELKKYVDALIIVSNDKLVFNNGNGSLRAAFKNADAVLAESVKTVTDIILKNGIINLDFADVKATLSNRGVCLIGIGTGTGEKKAIDAANNAINSPFLEASIKGAKNMIVNFITGDDCSLKEVNYAIDYINEQAGNETNIIMGLQHDDSYKDKVTISIIATNFPDDLDLTSDHQILERTTDFDMIKDKVQPVSKAESKLKEDRTSSPLPEYLKSVFSKNKPSTSSVVEEKIEEKKEAEFKVESTIKADEPKKAISDNDFVIEDKKEKEVEEDKEDDLEDDDTVIIPID